MHALSILVFLLTLTPRLASAAEYRPIILTVVAENDLANVGRFEPAGRPFTDARLSEPHSLLDDLTFTDLRALPAAYVAEAFRVLGRLMADGLHAHVRIDAANAGRSELEWAADPVDEALAILATGFEAGSDHDGGPGLIGFRLLRHWQRTDERPAVQRAIFEAWSPVAARLRDIALDDAFRARQQDRALTALGHVLPHPAAAAALLHVIERTIDGRKDRRARDAARIIAERAIERDPLAFARACQSLLN